MVILINVDQYLFKISKKISKRYDVIIFVYDLTNNFDHLTIYTSCIWSCDQTLVPQRVLSLHQFYKHFTKKTKSVDGCSWFKFNNLGLALGKTFRFYTSMEIGLKLKVKTFWGLIPTFAEVTTPILNKAN